MFDRVVRWVPGAAVSVSAWLAGPAAICFYFSIAVLAIRFDAWADMMSSGAMDDRLRAAAVVAGLMVLYLATILLQSVPRHQNSFLGSATRRFHSGRLGAIGSVLFLLLLVTSILGPLIAPYDPAEQVDPVADQYQPPSVEHPMGTDKFGRDIFTRVLYGSQTSLAVSVFAVVIASMIGLVIGAFAGFAGGWFDELVMRFVDGLLAFPRLLLVLTALALFANSFWVVVVLLALTGWMGISRLVRAEVLRLKELDFVRAAVATGVGRSHIVWKHLIPNLLGPVFVGATLRIGTIILLESYLSFLGLGVQPPVPSWGGMVFDGRDVLVTAWWVSAFPGLAIVAAVMACNLVGDGLRDSLDVRSSS